MQIEPGKKIFLIKTELILKQVSADLTNFISTSADSKKRIKMIANKTGIHVRTLDRIIKLENKPNYTTVFKIYKCMTDSKSYEEVISTVPELIRDFLLEGRKSTYKDDYPYQKLEHAEEICKNPVFAEIYLLCSSGFISYEEISSRFGDYGVKLAEEMHEKGVLKRMRPGQYAVGDCQIDLTAECLLRLGLIAAKNYAKPENGQVLDQHFMTFLAEGVSEEAFIKLCKVDEEAYQKKLTILKDPTNLGIKKFFTFTITDTLEKPEDDLKFSPSLGQEKLQ